MPTATATDGTQLAYRLRGEGPPLMCLPGGPMQDADYLGDLGGLSADRRLVLLDPRGTGGSGVPADAGSYRCDRLTGDVEQVREHLGLERVDLLAHSAGANLVALYAEQYPERVQRLVLVTPSVVAVGVDVADEAREQVAQLRRGEPWFPAASAALAELMAGRGGPEAAEAITPLMYGRWDAAARDHHAAQQGRRNHEAAAAHRAPGAFEPARTRVALEHLQARVLVLAGEVDLNSPPSAMAEVAAVYGAARLLVQPGTGHFPWVDDPERFVTAVTAFLDT